MEGWAESDGVQWGGSEKTVLLSRSGHRETHSEAFSVFWGWWCLADRSRVNSEARRQLGLSPRSPPNVPRLWGLAPDTLLTQTRRARGQRRSSSRGLACPPHPQLTGQMRGQEGQEHWTGNQTWSTTQKPWVGLAPSLHLAPEPFFRSQGGPFP